MKVVWLLVLEVCPDSIEHRTELRGVFESRTAAQNAAVNVYGVWFDAQLDPKPEALMAICDSTMRGNEWYVLPFEMGVFEDT